MTRIKVPGKLYLAGEYAVVEPGSPAILTAIDRFVYFSISSAKNDFGTIYSKQYQNRPVKWHRNKFGKLKLDSDVHLEYVMEAIRITEKYALEQGIKLSNFDLIIDSELDSTDGKKFGLGSSAAVTVGTVKAIAAFYHLNLDALTIFKLAALTHYNVQGNGSLGDIAASSFTGWIAYYSPDRNWLINQPQNNLSKLISTQWPELKIIRLTPSQSLQLVVGWSGSPASTKHLISEVKKKSHVKYEAFVRQSKKCVERLIQAVQHDVALQILQQINQNRKLLNELSNASQVELETPRLTKLINTVTQFGGAGKFSGAGGGDCGIGFIKSDFQVKQIFDQWKMNQILPLQLATFTSEDQ